MSTTDGSLVTEVSVDIPPSRPKNRASGGGQSRRRGWILFLRPMPLFAIAVVLVLLVFAVFAGQVAPFDPNQGDLLAVLKPPSRQHWLGTDHLGRDLFSRLVFGTRTSFEAAGIAVGTSFVIGIPAGLMAGYSGGFADSAISRVNDGLLAIPNLILALAVVAVLGPGLVYPMLAIGAGFVPRVFRVTRASAMSLQKRTFIEASLALGCSRTRLVLVHILPNCVTPLAVVASVSIGNAIIAEAGLSFLGLGVRPPTASWGGMLSDAAQRLDLRYLLYSPSLVLILAVIALTVLGDTISATLSSRRTTGE